ncbi:MAG: DMT family transporter, partial [Dokdonella sp.]
MPRFDLGRQCMGLGEALSIGSALAWACGVILYKRLGESLPPQNLNLLKNLLVLAMLVPTVLLLEGTNLPVISRQHLFLAVASGVVGIAVADTLYLHALNALGASRMGIMGNLYSPFVIVLSFLFLGERLGALQMVGFVLVMLGVLVVHGSDPNRHIDQRSLRRGLIYAALAIILMAVAIVMIKRVLEQHSLLWIVLLRLLGAVAGMSALFALRRENPLPRGVPVHWGTLLLAAFLGQYLSVVMWLGGYKYA